MPQALLFTLVAILSFANGANDNFKGVATIWGSGRGSYRQSLFWATAFTFTGSLLALSIAGGLASKFNGSAYLDKSVCLQAGFVGSVALAAAATVLIASRLGLPISTTHALTGGILGAGVMLAGWQGVKFAALGSGILLPLLTSPLLAVGLTFAGYPLVARVARAAKRVECVCVDQAQPVLAEADVLHASSLPSIRMAPEHECRTGDEIVRFRPAVGLLWFSGAAISFARGLNDTPKIAALLLVSGAAGSGAYWVVAVAMATGGLLGAARVARTMSREITPMATHEATTANLVAAGLVVAASSLAWPVSTTHVTSGGIFGIGVHRRGEADWKRVREILLSWAGTLPLAFVFGATAARLLAQ